jgi:hypothetical protein
MDLLDSSILYFLGKFEVDVAQLQHNSPQTSLRLPEFGILIRGNLLNPNNRVWAGQNC